MTTLIDISIDLKFNSFLTENTVRVRKKQICSRYLGKYLLFFFCERYETHKQHLVRNVQKLCVLQRMVSHCTKVCLLLRSTKLILSKITASVTAAGIIDKSLNYA